MPEWNHRRIYADDPSPHATDAGGGARTCAIHGTELRRLQGYQHGVPFDRFGCEACLVAEWKRAPAVSEQRTGEEAPEEILPWRELRARKPAIPYLLYYPAIRDVARSCGYALAIHGSLARDFDLIAVAWTADATDADTLVRAICDATEWLVTVPPKPGEKPHGRLGYTLMPCGTKTLRGAWIDLSVIPPRALASQGTDGAR